MAVCFLGFGSNIGDRMEYLSRALKQIGMVPGALIKQNSSIYETEPLGDMHQRKFLNMVSRIETGIPPHTLLEILMEIEKKLGRKRLRKWGPRTIDIDILLYDNMVIRDETLTIPHPEIKNRAFVLIPLKEIAPGLIIPGEGKVEDLVEKVANQGISFYAKPFSITFDK